MMRECNFCGAITASWIEIRPFSNGKEPEPIAPNIACDWECVAHMGIEAMKFEHRKQGAA